MLIDLIRVFLDPEITISKLLSATTKTRQEPKIPCAAARYAFWLECITGLV